MVNMIILGVEIQQGMYWKSMSNCVHTATNWKLTLLLSLPLPPLKIFRLLAELEKADRAFCFTSGMAALAAVTRLLQTGIYKNHTREAFA